MKFNAAISFLVFTACFCISMTTALRCSCSESTVSALAKRTIPANDAKCIDKKKRGKLKKDVMQLLKETNRTAENLYSSTKNTALRTDDACNNFTIIGREIKANDTRMTFQQLLNLTIYTRGLFGESDGLTSNITRLLCNYELFTGEGCACPVSNFTSASEIDLKDLDVSLQNDYKFRILCDIRNLIPAVHKHLEKPQKKKVKRTRNEKKKKNPKAGREKKRGDKSKEKKTKKSNMTGL